MESEQLQSIELSITHLEHVVKMLEITVENLLNVPDCHGLVLKNRSRRGRGGSCPRPIRAQASEAGRARRVVEGIRHWMNVAVTYAPSRARGAPWRAQAQMELYRSLFEMAKMLLSELDPSARRSCCFGESSKRRRRTAGSSSLGRWMTRTNKGSTCIVRSGPRVRRGAALLTRTRSAK